MSVDDLQRIVRRGAQYANQRIVNLERANLTEMSPAYQNYKELLKEGRFELTAKNRLRLVSDLRKIQHFLQTQTSTVKGARAYSKKMAALLPNVDEKNRKSFWRMYNEIRAANRVKFSQLDSGQVVKALQNIYDASQSLVENLKEMENVFNELYNEENEAFKSYFIDPREFR